MADARAFIAQAVLINTVPGFERSFKGEITLREDQLEQCNAILASISIEVSRLVEENWPAIERTAQALLERNILTGDEVGTIIAANALVPQPSP